MGPRAAPPTLDPTQQRAEGSAARYTFTLYIRLVLPLDGFVFWVKADQLSQSAVIGALGLTNTSGDTPFDQSMGTTKLAPTLNIEGAFHYATIRDQKEESSVAINSITFTTDEPIQQFNLLGPNAMYVATYQDIQFAFSGRGPFFPEAGINHYIGNAVYSTMESQLIDKLDGFSTKQIVSNSLPIWLGLNGFEFPYQPWIAGPTFKLYPSFLVPGNLTPPYAAVHIVPETTRPIAAAPTLGRTLSHEQLVQETVRITFYGVRNDDALSFVDVVNQYTLDNPTVMGIMNMPAIRDEKQAQVELEIIAQKKSIEFEVNYLQRSARNIARKIIGNAIPNYIFNEA